MLIQPLLALLALPLLAAALIVAVSFLRRAHLSGVRTEARHRFQSDSATVQAAAVHRPPARRTIASGRERRAAMARARSTGE